MKQKLRNLMVVSTAIVGCWSSNAWAQTIQDLETAGWEKVESIGELQVKDYYFIFVDAGSSQYLMANDVTNGRPCYRDLSNPLAYGGQTWILEGENDTFTLKSGDNLKYFNSGSEGWNDNWAETNVNANYKFNLASGKYSLVSTTTNQWVGPWNNNGSVADNGENVAANKSEAQAPGFFVYAMSRSDYQTKQAALLAGATKTNPVDMTPYIINPDFYTSLNGWTGEGTYTQNYKDDNLGFDGKPGMAEFCNWGANSWNGSITQIINDLPQGQYRIKALAQASDSNTTLTFKVNDKEVSLNCIGDTGGNVAADGSVVESGSGVKGWQYLTVECLIIDGTMTITGSSSATATQRWGNLDHVTIEYLGVDLTEFQTSLSIAVEKAQTLVDSETLPTAAKTALQTEIDNNNPEEGYTTADAYTKAINAVNAAYEKYNAWVAPYADYKAMRDDFVKADILNVTGVYTDKDNAVATLNSAIEAANTAVEAATEISAITEQTAKLREAALNFIKTVTIEEGKYFDLTKLMANPGFDNNTTDGWNITHTGDLNTRVQCNEFYQATFDMYQTLTGLPNGSYTLSVKAFMRPGWADAVYNDFNNGINKVSAKLYVNNDESTIKNIMEHLQDTKLYNSENGGFADSEVDGKFIPNGMEGAQVYFAKGFYDTSVAALVNDGNLKLGFKNETSEGGYWTIFDDFRLYYYGTSEFIYKKQYFPQVQVEAQATLDNKLYENVAGAEKAGLTTAIATTPENTEEAYDAAITQIKEAQTAFIAAAPSYNRLVAAIATAKAQEVDCTDAESTLAAATTTAETAVSAANTLYTAVLNTFSMNELGFAAGECAPYNNVEAIQTFNKKAETIKDIASKSEADIDAMIQELKSVTWNVNDTEVNAVYDGNFALQEEQLPDTPNSAVLAGWNIKGGNMRYLIKNTEDYPGLNGASEKAAVFTYGGNYAYGETEGYTIPLKANTVYELSFKLAGWGGDGTGSVDKYNVSVLNENQEGLALTNVGGAPTGIKVENSLVNAKVRFRTGEAGNYVLTMNPGGNSVFTDVELLTAKAEDIAVKVSAEYGTMILPFDAEIPSNMEVYSVGSCSEQTEEYSVLNLEPVTDKIAANTPYIVKSDAIDFTFNGIALNNGNAYTDGLLTGVMTATPVPNGSYVLQKQEGKLGFYLVETDDIIVPANRAYLTIPETAAANVRAFVFDLGNVTGINHVEAADALVNVYSIDGVLVRKAVKASEALNGLQKGIYVVNGAKKAVK